MNFPIWEQPAPGLLIALIAIVHVFVAHIAVGGGLFLVVTERRARRAGDTALLAYLERHTRVFALLTLVFGALTGVGIWFVIGLVHPSATTTLIQLFLWIWAIEWTFFVVEIAAALVYAHGWRRLSPAMHERVGWVYAVSAWMSLAVINGILSFMLTPGSWLASRSLADAFFNPTYAPSLVARTATAVGLAGLYALLTASWMTDGDVKARLARYAALRWILPAAVVLPIALAWFLAAAAAAGVDVGGVFGAASGSIRDLVGALRTGTASGHPIARAAATAVLAGSVGLVVFLAIGVLRRPARFGPLAVVPVLACALVAFGGAEFVREDLRKPYVITGVMFVNGVRVGPSSDHASIAQVNARGVLASARFVASHAPQHAAGDDIARLDAEGRAIARLLCATCHTTDGYLALRPLVRGLSVATLDTVLAMLAVPVDGRGMPTTWEAPHPRLRTWRGRFMPPFVGTDAERHALAVHLALLGGATVDEVRVRTVEPLRERFPRDREETSPGVIPVPSTPGEGSPQSGGNLSRSVPTALPAPDPLPQPGPTWLLWSLLLVTFTLHLVAMNLALGGSVVALIARWRAFRGADAHARTFTSWYAKALPTIIAATVSFGVAPLLFVQVLYGRALFGSSILMAWPWLSVFVLVILAYYAAYRLAHRANSEDRGITLAMLVAAIFLLVAFIYANNMSLALRVGEFGAMVAGGVRGVRLNLDDATLVPRYLHIVIGSMAVAGACTAGLGWLRRQRDDAFARWAMRYGSGWAAIATFANLFAGSWWLMSLPRDVLARLAGGDAAATVVLMLGIGAALVALLAFAAASRATDPAPPAIVGLASLAPTLLAMVFTRDQLREASFARAGLGDAPIIASQWGAIALFAACFVGALLTIAWLVRAWRQP